MLWHGKNFRGFLNKAREVLFDNTGTTLQSDNVQDAISEIDSDLSKHNIGNVVDLSGYTSTAKYTFPSDGYIRMSFDTTAGINAYAAVQVHSGDNDSNYFTMTCDATSANEGRWNSATLFVKKGMRVSNFVSDNTNAILKFYPII